MTEPDPPHARLRSLRGTIEDKIIECLDAAIDLTTSKNRQLLVKAFSRASGRQVYVPDLDTSRDWVVTFVEGCIDLEAGLSSLVRTMSSLRPRSSAATELQRLLDAWDSLDIAAQAPEKLWKALQAELGDVSSVEAGSAYRKINLHPHPPDHCANAWHVLLHAAACRGERSALPPWVGFLVYCSAFLAPATRVGVEQWLSRFAYHQRLTPMLQETRLAAGRPPVAGVFYLIVQFEPDKTISGQFLMTVWHNWAGADDFHLRNRRSLRRDELEAATGDAIREAETLLADDPTDIFIELVLPFDLLGESVETWLRGSAFGPSELVMDYPVVVRSLERLRAKEVHRRWWLRWLEWHRRDASAGAAEPGVLDARAHLDTDDIDVAIAKDKNISMMILSSPLDASDDASTREFQSAMRAGLPVVGWHRSADVSIEEAGELLEILRTAEPERLPQQVQVANLTRLERSRRVGGNRSPKSGGRRSPGRVIALLADDPRRQPECAVAARIGRQTGNRT